MSKRYPYRFLCSVLFMATLLSSHGLAADYPGSSVFHLKGKWLDTNGKDVSLADYGGKTLVLAMVYTTCQYSCPLILEEMGRVKKKVPPTAAANTRYVLVSFDPKRDTPEALRAYAKKKKLDPNSWILLTAKSEDPVRELSAALGVNYKKTGEDFTHSNIITVLSPKGEIIFTKNSIGQDLDEAVDAIIKLSR